MSSHSSHAMQALERFYERKKYFQNEINKYSLELNSINESIRIMEDIITHKICPKCGGNFE